MLKDAQNLAMAISSDAAGISDLYSDDVQQNPLWRGLKVGTEIAFTAQMALATPGIVKGLPKVPGKISSGVSNISKKSLSPSKMWRSYDDAAKTVKKNFFGDDLIKVGDDYVKRDPFAKKAWETLKPTIKNRMSGKEIAEQLKIWNKAYKASRGVKDSAKAGIYDVLARETKRQMSLYAPEMWTAYGAAAKASNTSNFIGKMTRMGIYSIPGIIAGTIVGGSIVKAFGGRGD